MNNNNSAKNKDILEVLRHLDAFVEEQGWKDKYADVMEYLYIEHILITTINRLENQENREKKEVIRYLTAETLQKYPKFYKDPVFATFPKNRQVVARLNGMGLSALSKMIFYIKSKL